MTDDTSSYLSSTVFSDQSSSVHGEMPMYPPQRSKAPAYDHWRRSTDGRDHHNQHQYSKEQYPPGQLFVPAAYVVPPSSKETRDSERLWMSRLNPFSPSNRDPPSYKTSDKGERRKSTRMWPGEPKHLLTSSSTPELHPLLTADTLISYDVRKRPRDGIYKDMYDTYRYDSATQSPVRSLRIISDRFPWVIDIRVREERDARSSNVQVRVRDVWNALYDELQKPVKKEEWALLFQLSESMATTSGRNTFQSRIKGALARRQHSGDDDHVIRRVDWLGRKTKFTGLVKDDFLVKESSLPGQELDDEVDTWVAKLAE